MTHVHTGNAGAYCGSFTVHGMVPMDAWERRSTSVCLTLEGSKVLDVTGASFPDARECVTYDYRCAHCEMWIE